MGSGLKIMRLHSEHS